MKKLEIILIIGSVIGVLMAVLNVPLNALVVSVFFLMLSLLYLYLGFALFNDIPLRKIFNPKSYKGIGTWRIFIASRNRHGAFRTHHRIYVHHTELSDG